MRSRAVGCVDARGRVDRLGTSKRVARRRESRVFLNYANRHDGVVNGRFEPRGGGEREERRARSSAARGGRLDGRREACREEIECLQ